MLSENELLALMSDLESDRVERTISTNEATFDARPCREARLEDLELNPFLHVYCKAAVVAEIIQTNNRSLEEQLAAL